MMVKYLQLMAQIIVVAVCSACTQKRAIPKQPQSSLATVVVGSLDLPNYDQIRLSVFRDNVADAKALEVEVVRGQRNVQGQVSPGAYNLELEYLENGQTNYTSKDCGNKKQYDLKPGLNAITIYVCDASGQRITVAPPEPTTSDPMLIPEPSPEAVEVDQEADLDITPVYRQENDRKQRGKLAYDQHCAFCHGENGSGTVAGPRLVTQPADHDAFILRTTNTMPPSNPSVCDKTCATEISIYLFD